MSVQRTKKKRGGMRKHGRHSRKPCNQRYVAENRRYRNKLKRVRKSCGEAFARAWEREHGKTYKSRLDNSIRSNVGR